MAGSMTLRTIVLLSAKRTGSTALFRVFQRHPAVGVGHIDQAIDNWEPNFWNLAAQAIAGECDPFMERMTAAYPFLGGVVPRSEDEAFELWDRVVAELGPIVFDKSPGYLCSRPGVELLMRYAQSRSGCVSIFGLIRDARDAIASQLDRFRGLVEGDSPAFREKLWLKRYDLLEELRDRADIPIFRYEDIVADPDTVMPQIMEYCKLEPIAESWAHLRPVNVGRHRRESDAWWTPSPALIAHLQRFGYVSASRAAS